jgi:hypothetical protein
MRPVTASVDQRPSASAAMITGTRYRISSSPAGKAVENRNTLMNTIMATSCPRVVSRVPGWGRRQARDASATAASNTAAPARSAGCVTTLPGAST